MGLGALGGLSVSLEAPSTTPLVPCVASASSLASWLLSGLVSGDIPPTSSADGVDGALCFSRAQGRRLGRASWTDLKRVRAVGAVISSVQGIPPCPRFSAHAFFSRRKSLWTQGMVIKVQTPAHAKGRVQPSCTY